MILNPSLARRELGQELVSLTEMWLDNQNVSMLVQMECGVAEAQLMEMKGKAEQYGWDSRYGLLYTQLERKKLRLRHMLYHCYCTYHDPACGNLMDSGMFV